MPEEIIVIIIIIIIVIISQNIFIVSECLHSNAALFSVHLSNSTYSAIPVVRP